MIVRSDEIWHLPEFQDLPHDYLDNMLDAMETMVRKFTNNNFQNRNIRFLASSEGAILNGASPFIQEGDTIQVSESGINDGLYVVQTVENGKIKVDRSLFAHPHNLVTKVIYPTDVKMGVINLLKWEVGNRDKVGIKSETISRHTVTYFDQDSSNQVNGYPVSLLGFLTPYMKARF